MGEPYLRMCQKCLERSIIVKDGCTECTCPVCDTVNKIRWLPQTYIEVKHSTIDN